jgi:putative flippase GtrA
MLKKFTKYATVGAIATLIYMGMLVALVEVFGLDPVWSSVISFIFILIGSYFANQNWTFRSGRGHLYSLPRYIAVSLSGLSLNTGIMYVTVNILGWWYIFGQVVAIFVVPLSNFLLNFYWSFREDQDGR